MKLSDEEKLELVQFKDDDPDYIRAMKSELQMTLAMPEHERKVFYQQQHILDDELHLQWMIDQNKYDDAQAAEFAKRAKEYINNYQLHGDEADLERAEQWAEIAKGTKANRYSIADIRKQRERIQWHRRRLKELIASQPTEQKPSSNHSTS